VSRRTYGSYNDGCAAAHALDLIGERWTLIVVRELLLGPKRFSDIQNDVIGIGPSMLTRRLHELESAGIARRRRLSGLGQVDVYELTEWGYGLEAVNTALSLWAVHSPALPLDADMSPDTTVLAMRAHACPLAGIPHDVVVSLHLTDSRRDGAEPVAYLAHVSTGATTIEKRWEPPDRVDAEIVATTRDWKACIIGGVGLHALDKVLVTGDEEAAQALVSATSLSPRH
jgi:DNA-binding HxlR family transcriptional regulator